MANSFANIKMPKRARPPKPKKAEKLDGPKKPTLGQRILRELKRNWILYVMMIPVIAYFILYHYAPMYGIQIAFKKFNSKLGIVGSKWVGFDHFERFLSSYNFKNLLKNTLGISLYSLVVSFPLPIIFALLLHYLDIKPLKKFVQMISYAPHFLSTVIIASILILFCSKNGFFNIIGSFFGLEKADLLAKPELFKHIYVWSSVWESIGWSAIIYIAALSGVDQQMHEAAIVDGASKLQRMLHIDLPSIVPTIVMLLILKMGGIMSVGFEKAFLLQNDLNLRSSQIISTYVYELGLLKADYSFSTAVGLFNNVINVTLMVLANTFSKKVLKESLW